MGIQYKAKLSKNKNEDYLKNDVGLGSPILHYWFKFETIAFRNFAETRDKSCFNYCNSLFQPFSG